MSTSSDTPSQVRTGRIRRSNETLILIAAEQEFARRGFDGASIGRIARSAGVARANVHYYFKSREKLYLRVLDDIVDRWNQSFPENSSLDEPYDIIKHYIAAKLHFSRHNPAASKIFAGEILRGAPLMGDRLESIYSNWLHSKVGILKSWMQAGKMDSLDPYHVIFMIWSSTQHYADFDFQVKTALKIQEYSEDDFEKISATLTHIILKGCGLSPQQDALL